MDKYPEVKVTWEDAETHDEWEDIADLKIKTSTVVTIGYLINDGEVVTVAQNINPENDAVSMVINIPGSWVDTIEYL